MINSKVEKHLYKGYVVFIACCVMGVCLFLIINYAMVVATYLFESIMAGIYTFHFPNFFTFHADWWIAYIVIVVVILLFLLRFAYKMRKSFEPINQNQKGSCAWLDLSELKKQYRAIPEKKEFYSGKSGFPISRYGTQIFIDDNLTNCLVVGITRSGKGEICILPYIDICSRAKKIKDRPSLIVADPKGELSALSSKMLKDRDYDVQVFDLLNFNGMSFNPLQIVLDAYLEGDTNRAQSLTQTLSFILFNDPTAKDKTWQTWSIALTNALIFAVITDCCQAAKAEKDPIKKQEHYDKITLYSVARLLTDFGQITEDDKSGSKLDLFFRKRPLDDIGRMQYASVEAAQGKTKGNIYANTLAVLTKFTMSNIARMTAKNTLDLKSVGFDSKKPTAIFLVTPDYDFSNEFLLTIFISQLYYVLAKNSTKRKSNKCDREVSFVLDEFGNIPAIPNMSRNTAVCLGRNIRFILIIQSYSQVNHLYGNDDAKSIIDNCGNKIYLLTSDPDTAKNISGQIGPETISVSSRSGDPLSMDKKFQEHVSEKPLLDANELMQLLPGESVVIRTTKRYDVNANKTKPKPIYNHGDTIMKYRYEYLDDFDDDTSFDELNLKCIHNDISLESILYRNAAMTTQEEKPTDTEKPEADKVLSELLSNYNLNLINTFLGDISIDYDTITASQFENIIQSLAEGGKISQDAYDDIFDIICSKERSENN